MGTSKRVLDGYRRGELLWYGTVLGNTLSTVKHRLAAPLPERFEAQPAHDWVAGLRYDYQQIHAGRTAAQLQVSRDAVAATTRARLPRSGTA